MLKHIINIQLTFLCTTFLIYSITIPPEYQVKSDSLFNLSTDKHTTFVETIKKDSSVIYYASTCRTLPYDAYLIKRFLQSIHFYKDAFDFIKKSEKLANRDNQQDSLYFIVAKSGPVKTWFLCNVDSTIYNNSIRYNVRKNKNELLNNKVRDQVNGLFVIEYNEFNIYWLIKEIDNNKTRVALISIVDPKVWVPNWLFKLVSKILYPNMLEDLEKFIEANKFKFNQDIILSNE